MNGIRPNWTPVQVRNPFTDQNQTQHNSLCSGNSSRAKTHHQPIKGIWPTKSQHISFMLDFFSFYFVRFLAQRPAKTARPILTIYTSNDAVLRKEVPFGGRNACKNFQGFISPKTPLNWARKGITSLNKSRNNFSTVHAISAHISSIGAAWRMKF